MIKASDLRTRTPDALREELEELRKENFRLRMQKATQQLSKTHNLRRVRRDIAVVMTVLREKRGAAPAGEKA